MSSEQPSTKWQRAWDLLRAREARAAVDLLLHGPGEEAEEGPREAARRGHALLHAGRPREALAPLAEAIAGLEADGDRDALALALGDRAGALRAVGELAEAEATMERALALVRGRGDLRREAAGLAQMGEILRDQRRLDEAEQRYDEALAAAREAGDEGLESSLIQHLAILALAAGRPELAVRRGRDALARFQAAGNQPSAMRTANLLGAAAEGCGDLDGALGWYTEAERLAHALGDDAVRAAIAANVAILLETRALALPDDAEGERRRHLAEAAASLRTALALDEARGEEVGAAAAHHELGIVLRHLGELDAAERHALGALAFYEARALPEEWKACANLEGIAAARGHAEEAATWGARKAAKRAAVEGAPR